MVDRTKTLAATYSPGKEESVTAMRMATEKLSEKHRVQIDFQKEALDELDRLQTSAQLKTRADAIRYGLRLLQWFTQQIKDGNQVLVKKTNGEVREIVFLPIQQ